MSQKIVFYNWHRVLGIVQYEKVQCKIKVAQVLVEQINRKENQQWKKDYTR